MADDTSLKDAIAEAQRASDEAALAAADAAEKTAAAKVATEAHEIAITAETKSLENLKADPDNAELKAAAEAATAEVLVKAEARKEAAASAEAAVTAAKRAADNAAVAKDIASKASLAQELAEKDAAKKDASGPMLVTAPLSTSYFDLLKAVVSDNKLNGEEKKMLLLQLKEISPTSDRLTEPQSGF